MRDAIANLARRLMPGIIAGLLSLVVWEAAVRAFDVPSYLLPAPSVILTALSENWTPLSQALLVTIRITLVALIASALSGLALASLLVQSRLFERALLPYTVILQTTPIVAVAPLLIIWLKNDIILALIICAWLASVFPVISSTVMGLRGVDPLLRKLFALHGATRWRTFVSLQLPSALPYFFAGLRVSGGLALIGAIAAEFVAGTGGSKAGIAYLVLMASYNLEIPKMFAGLFLISACGIVLFGILTLLGRLALRNHPPSQGGEDGAAL